MIEIELFGSDVSEQILIPGDWNEFDLPELEQMASAIGKHGNKIALVIGIVAYRAAKDKAKLPDGWQARLWAEDVATGLLSVADHWFGKNTLTRNPIPSIVLRPGQKIIGPGDDFNDMTCGEFESCEVSFLLYAQNKELKHLADLAHTLWRPELDHKKRVSYDPDQGASFFTEKDAVNLQVIWLWYIGCRMSLASLFPDIFPQAGSSEGEEEKEASAESEVDLTAFTRLIHSGAGERNGSRKEIRAMLLKEFLFDVQLQMELQREMEEKMKTK